MLAVVAELLVILTKVESEIVKFCKQWVLHHFLFRCLGRLFAITPGWAGNLLITIQFEGPGDMKHMHPSIVEGLK